MTDVLQAVIAATELPDEVRVLAETAEANGHRAVKEPLVYQLHEERSYFADLALSSLNGDSAAGERIGRHPRQMAATRRFETGGVRGADYESGVNPTLEGARGFDSRPPLWLN